MSVKVKDVGNYKIHVKETTTRSIYGYILCMICWMIFISLFYIVITPEAIGNNKFILAIIAILYIPIGIFSALSVLDTILDREILPRFFSHRNPAYYVDTTMYGVGGKTIRKTTPDQDHIAICQAAQEFEKEILEHINKEKELEEIVGKCK